MEKKTLGEVADYINGRAFKPDEWEDDGLPIIRIQNLTGSTDVCNRTTKTYEKKYLVVDGDLLFAWSASLGAHIWHGENGWLNQHIFKVVPHEGTNKQYLYYYLLHVVDQLYAKTHGSGMVHITLKPFKNTEIYMPALPEQQRIVDRIESLFAKLDEAKQKAQDALDSFETRKAAILHKAFTGELTAQWRKEHGVGMESWTHSILGRYLQPLESKKPQGKEFRYIDIDSIDNINQVVREPKKVIVENAPSRANRGLKANDILFSMVRPYLKNIAYIDENLSDCIASTGFYVCRCNQELLPRYLYHFLCSKDAIDYLMQFMKGDNSPSIRKNDLLEMPVSFPLISEQTEIVHILDTLLAEERQAKETAEAVLEQIDLIKKSILTRAFRGELGTNDPTEESAVKLVKKYI